MGINKFAKQVNGGDIVFYDFDVPPMLLNDRTPVPARAAAEAYDCTVDWNGNTQTVDIWE